MLPSSGKTHPRTSADPPPPPGKGSPRPWGPLGQGLSPLRSPSPHLWHPPQPSLKTTQQGSCPRKPASRPGNRDVARRGGHRDGETGPHAFGGPQGLGPSGEGRAALLRLSKGCGAEKYSRSGVRGGLHQPQAGFQALPPHTPVKVNIHSLPCSDHATQPSGNSWSVTGLLGAATGLLRASAPLLRTMMSGQLISYILEPSRRPRRDFWV